MNGVRVADRRRVPFFMVGKPDLARLAESCDSRSLPFARSVYFALLELANDQRCEEVAASRAEVASKAGVSVATVKRCAPLLAEAGLIEMREVPGYPNVWTLLGGEEGGSAGPTPGGSTRTGGRVHENRGAGLLDPPLNNGSQEVKKEDDSSSSSGGEPSSSNLPEEMLRDAHELLRAKRKVDERLVTEREMMVAAAALAEFNRQAEADFGLGANLRAIVMRVRERPSWDAAKHERLVQSAWRIKWWRRNGNRRRPTPQVIYGNPKVFEQVVQDAADEHAGRRIVIDAPRERRYFDGRLWHELTTAEQLTARDLMGRGIDPLGWRQEEAVAVVPSGNGVTAENFLD